MACPGLLIAWDKTRGRMDVAGIAGLAAHPFILDTNKPNVKKLADFTDEDRIATPATTSPQAILMRMAAEQEFGPGQFARIDKLLVSMPHPDATAALLSGTISGYVATPPFIAPLAKSDKIHAVVTSKQILGGQEATGAALGAGKKFVDANPKVVAAIVAALDDAHDFIAKDPDAAADIYIKSEILQDAESAGAGHADGRYDHLFGGADRHREIRPLHGRDRRDQERAQIVAGCVLSRAGRAHGKLKGV